MSLLTTKQRAELNKAIFQYTQAKIAAADDANDQLLPMLAELLEIKTPNDEIVPNYLEKKWTTVVRLQKRILDLENEVASYKLLLETLAQSGSNGSALVLPRDKLDWIPNVNTTTYKTLSTQLINCVAVHPVLPLVVAGASDGSIIAWNMVHDSLAIPQKIVPAHTRSVTGLRWLPSPAALVPNGPQEWILASCSLDLSVKIWEGDSLKHVRTLSGHEHTVSSVAFLPTNPLVLYSVSRDLSVRVWDVANGTCTRKFVGHSEWARDVDAASVEQHLVDAGTSGFLGDFLLTCSNDQSIRLSHASSGIGLALLLGHTHVIESVKFLPLLSNKYLDGFVLLNLDKFSSLSEDIVKNPAYEENLGYKYCVSAGRDSLIKLWLLPPPTLRPNRPPAPSELNNSQGWHLADLIGHQSWVKSLSVHPLGRYLFSGGDDKAVRVWDFSTLMDKGLVRCIKTLTAHEGFVSSVHMASFEISGTKDSEKTEEALLKRIEHDMRCIFVTGGVDKTVRIWS